MDAAAGHKHGRWLRRVPLAPARVWISDLLRANTQRCRWIMCSINLESISTASQPRWFENNCFPAYDPFGQLLSVWFDVVWSGLFMSNVGILRVISIVKELVASLNYVWRGMDKCKIVWRAVEVENSFFLLLFIFLVIQKDSVAILVLIFLWFSYVFLYLIVQRLVWLF